jgi:hypothetical protein
VFDRGAIETLAEIDQHLLEADLGDHTELNPAAAISSKASLAPSGLMPIAVSSTFSHAAAPRERRRLDRHVERRVDELESARLGNPRHARDLVDHLPGRAQPLQAAFDAGIGAVDAAEWTAALGLDRPGEAGSTVDAPVDPALRPEARSSSDGWRELRPTVCPRQAMPGRPPGSAVERGEQRRKVSPSPITA